jgi:hypothetical protein
MSRPWPNVINPERPRLRRFQERVADLIPCESEAARADLRRMGIRELLGRYVNWADRYVTPRRRRVVTWEGFLRNGSPPSHWEAVQHLAKKIEAGDDLMPFLSEDIDRFGYVRPKVIKRPRYRMAAGQGLRLECLRDASPAPEYSYQIRWLVEALAGTPLRQLLSQRRLPRDGGRPR